MKIVLNNNRITLRSLESYDIDWLLLVENNTENWKVSGTTKAFTRETITSYVALAQENISTALQYRFVIERENIRVGLIDLFDYDSINNKVGVGILVLTKFQNTGVGDSALRLLMEYCVNQLKIELVYANIAETNIPSIRLFKNNEFILTPQKDSKNHFDKSILLFQRKW